MKGQRARLIDHYCEEFQLGRMDFTKMNAELARDNIDEAERKIIFQQVDRMVTQAAEEKVARANARNMFWGGAVVAFIGLFITIGTFTGYIKMGNQFLIAYGPVVFGLAIMAANRNGFKS